MKARIEALWNKRPLLISGPCSAETENQVLQTAERLLATGKIDLFRSGIWKPRTKPGQFEGIGSTGLRWLQQVRQQFSLPVTVEVAKAKHVEEALKHEIDVLWIGARTTVNPFNLQEIADALRGVNIPVLIKNPISPDIELWSGAVERMKNVGLNYIGMIHRGFSSYGKSQYRNAPMWQIPIEMKRRFPDMLMVCDPSHICGNRSLLMDIAQKSIDLDMNGLMIETHIDPDHAWSDASQQITPEEWLALINTLVWRKDTSTEAIFLHNLNKIRHQIDHIDDELLDLMAERMKLADLIGEYKRDSDITILQSNRWNEIVERALNKGTALGLSHEFIYKYFDAIHLESINHQNRVMNESKATETDK